jgi:hypothetical protein
MLNSPIQTPAGPGKLFGTLKDCYYVGLPEKEHPEPVEGETGRAGGWVYVIVEKSEAKLVKGK